MYLLYKIYASKVIVETAPELFQKGIFVYVLDVMLTLAKCKITILFCEKVLNLKLEHFESYSSFSYCTHSSV